MNSLQMRTPVQAEQTDGVLLPRLQDQPHRIGTVGSDRQRVFHGAREFRQRGVLQQPQHLDELARAVLLQFGLLAATQHDQTVGQLPVLQRLGVVQRSGLAFQEGQIVDRIELGVLLAPVTRMPGYEPIPDHQANLFDPADHRHVVMRVLGRNRVIVALKTHQRQGIGPRRFHPAGLELLLRQRQEPSLLRRQEIFFGRRFPAQLPAQVLPTPLLQLEH